ncbi:MAG: GLUG motif-containing protein, partial [Oscillospiraceae bacterium]
STEAPNTDTPKAPGTEAPNSDTPKAPGTDNSSRNAEGAAPAPAMGVAPAILSTVATWADVAAKAASAADYEWNAENTVVTIKTATGLAWVANESPKPGIDGFLGKTVVLGADIDLNAGLVTNYDAANITPTNSWEPIGTFEANATEIPFRGTFDGQGHTVSGVKINDAAAVNQALFGHISNTATVKNVGVINSAINAKVNASGVVGNNGGTVANCYNTSAVTATATNANDSARASGVVGFNRGTVTNCYNTGAVTATATGTPALATAGGVVGNNDGTVTNCYNTGAVIATIGAGAESYSCAGGVVGQNGGIIVANYYLAGTATKGVGSAATEAAAATLQMTDADMKGAAFVATLNKKLDELKDTALYAWKEVANSYPTFSDAPWGQALPATWADVAATVDTDYSVSGTTYTIKTATGLAWLANETNKTGSDGFLDKIVVLAKDINLDIFLVRDYNTNVTATNSWAPIGTATSQFKGTFNGQGYTVSGVKINNTANNQGLFGHISNTATVKNVGIVSSDITATDNVGGVVGNNGGTVTNCYNAATLTGANVGGVVGNNGGTVTNSYNTATLTGTNVGGVVGNNGGTVTNSYNTATLTGTNVGGVVGQNAATAKVANCYNTGAVNGSANAKVGGVVGDNSGTVTNCYYINTNIQEGIGGTINNPAHTTAMTDAAMKDAAFVETLNTNLDALKDLTLFTWKAGKTPNTYPIFTGLVWDKGLCATWADVAANAKSPVDYVWNGEKTVVTIKTATGLAWFANEVVTSKFPENFKDKTIELANDIDLNTGLVRGYQDEIAADGKNGWTPIGNKAANFSGTFDGKGYTVSGVKINNIADYQGLFGYIGETATVKNVGVKSSNINAGGNVGGVVGYSIGKVIDCYNEAVVSGRRTAGEPEGAVGGVVGKNVGGTVTNCHNTGAVFGSAAGGVVGYNLSQTIQNCYNTGAVTGGDWAGGVVGHSNEGTVINCHNTGDVIRGNGSSATSVGGVVGETASSTVTNCYNTGKVIGGDNDKIVVGGVVGHNGGGTITNCHNTGAISATGKDTKAGGVAGVHAPNTQNDNQITNCYNTGTVSGGLGNGFAVGGVVGTCYAKTTNCYNTGALSGAAANSMINVGGVAGESGNKNVITNCYYLKATDLVGIGGTTTDVSANTIGMTDTQMKDLAFVDTLNKNLDTIINTSLYTWKAGTAPNVYPTFTDILWAKKFPTTWKELALNSVKGTDYEKPFEKSYIIMTAAGLAWFANAVNTATIDFTGITVTIDRNIVLNPDTEIVKGYKDALTATNSWTPIGTETNPFKGTFDGKCVHNETIYTISGVKTNNPVNNQGLFGYISSTATVKNVGVVSSDITATAKDNIGGVVGNNEGIVDRCYYTGKVGGGNAIGGVVGNNGGTVTNSYSTATLTGAKAGGVAGHNGGTITNSYSTATLTGTNVGGVVGQNAANCTVVNCYSTGAVSGDANAKAGGVAGTNNGKVVHCYSTATLTGAGVGGVAGANSGTIEKCYYVNTTIKNGISGITDNSAHTVGMADAAMKDAAFVETLNKN